MALTEFKTVKKVQFGIFSPEDIIKTSVVPNGICHVEFTEEGRPKRGGLMDPKMGAMDNSPLCETCLEDTNICPGHFGHIVLAKPVFHVSFLNTITKVLRCVCFNCSKLLVNPEENTNFKKALAMTKRRLARRLDLVYDLCKNQVTCCAEGGCKQHQPTIQKTDLQLTAEWRTPDEDDLLERMILSAEEVRNIFKKISDTDCTALGMDPKYSRPEWMILTVLPVPPPSVRPAVVMNGFTKCQDDLTYKLVEIIKTNNMLMNDKKDTVAEEDLEKLKMLQYHVATLIDKNLTTIPEAQQNAEKLLKSIACRLKGKEGRIRGNLMGKRVDFSARSVITPDPNIKIDELGVPEVVAKKLFYPDIVTPFNFDQIVKFVQNGPKKYPGAQSLIRQDGKRFDLRFQINLLKLNLQVGDKVERHLIDGDLVIFNRQPSLHKMSMMGHRVKVFPFSTFRLNLSCTTPYNADFDGDEMNMHVPQSLATRSEVECIHISSRQILTPQANKPFMGIVQDTLTGCMDLTKRDVFLNRQEFMNLLMFSPSWNGKLPKPAIMKPVAFWTGKQLFSIVIPGALNVTKTHSAHLDKEDTGPYKWISPNDTRVLVENGELIMGILCKKTLGACAGSLLHVCNLELGHEICGKLYEEIQTVVNAWLLNTRAYSVSISDAVVKSETRRKIQVAIKQAKTEVTEIIRKAYNSELGTTPGENLKETFEREVNGLLNEARDKTSASVKQSLTAYNKFNTMAVAGSKGSSINILQIMACVGQQNVNGKRIKDGYKQRTLPHFQKINAGPEAKGFVENSFVSGLKPWETYFHAMGGREGLIDTACKTAETGYIQRRLIKAMESVKVEYDGTVRTPTGLMIQTSYGEDGLAAENLEFQNLPTVKLTNTEFENKYRFDVANHNYLKQNFTEDVNRDFLMSNEVFSELKTEWEQLKQDRNSLLKIFSTGESEVVLPCNLKRMILNAQKMFHVNQRKPTDLSPLKVVRGVRQLLEKCVVIDGNDEISKTANQNATLLFSCLARSILNTKSVAKYRLDADAFEWLMKEIEYKFQRALVVPGEMVGALSAQSIGEPATQMTLNTFHFAGVSSKNVTLGVPRLNEILDCLKNPKSPSMTIYLKEHIARDLKKTQNVMCRLERTTLKSVTTNSKIFYDPDPRNTVIRDDQKFVNTFYEIRHFDPTKISPWLLRLELDKKKIYSKKIYMKEIIEKINYNFGRGLVCFFSDDNADNLVLHIRIMAKAGESTCDENICKMDDLKFIKRIENTLLGETTLKGIPELSKIYMSKPQANEKKRKVVSEDGKITFISEWVLETDGTNLAAGLSDPDVDERRTITNDIHETLRILGVEAARKIIEKEINAVLQCYGLYVNSRHLLLLCDVISTHGNLMSITRHGINKQSVSPLMKCSFEESANVLVEAACHAEVDLMKGVSENIILGQLNRIGTGCVDLLVNIDKCETGMSKCGVSDFIKIDSKEAPSSLLDTIESFSTPKELVPSSSGISYPTSAYSTSFPQHLTTLPGYSHTSPSSSLNTQRTLTPHYLNSSNSTDFGNTTPRYCPTSPPYQNLSNLPDLGNTTPSYSPTSPSYSRKSSNSNGFVKNTKSRYPPTP